jgi:ABC-2 type transport system ATP-binding protein
LTAVDGIDLEVRRGECLGLLGPNGAGKTTTVEMLEGLTQPDSGTIEIFGTSWGTGQDRQLRERLGVQLQETRLPDKLTVHEIVRLFRSFVTQGRTVEEAIAAVALEPKRNSRVVNLSGGQRQRLAIACALVGDPDLLFLDEPTTGLDPQARRQLWELVQDFLDGGGTVLLTTHYMEEAERLCDRVAVMDRGQVIALGSPKELIASLGGDQIVELELSGPDETYPDALLDDVPGVRDWSMVERSGAQVHVLTVADADIDRALPAVLERLAARRRTVTRLATHEASLEDVFVHLTGRGLRDDA